MLVGGGSDDAKGQSPVISYDVGYLNYDETVEEIIAASNVLKKTYTSWKAMADNYLMGGYYWENYLSVGFTKSMKRRLDAANWLITNNESPWIQNEWPAKKSK